MNENERRKDQVDMAERVTRLETQMARFISDAESEKGTRQRANASLFEHLADLEAKMFKVNRHIWIATGAVGTLVFVLNFLVKHQ